MNFGATDHAVHFDRRNAFSFNPVFATEARYKQRVFPNAAPSSDGFRVNDIANNFHKFSLPQNLWGGEEYACALRKPSMLALTKRSLTNPASRGKLYLVLRSRRSDFA